MELEKLLENGKITASCQTNLSLKKTQLQPVSIFLIFFFPFLLLYLLCYLYLLFMF